MITSGAIVVHKHGKDKDLYTISKVNNEDNTCTLSSSTRTNKTSSVESIREADDIEIMIGYRQ